MISSNNINIYSDPDLNRKVKKTCDKITENLYVASNEPMLACYRIQEHVHKTIPLLTEKMLQMRKNETELKGLLYDIEYSQSTIKSFNNCSESFMSIHKMLKDCVFYKQQIDYNESVKQRVQNRIIQEQESQESQTSPSRSLPTTSRIGVSKKSSNTFNRFSTSFDFSSASFPINIASSVSADLKDLKSLISQFTSNNIQHHGKERTSVVASNSLSETQVLDEENSLQDQQPIHLNNDNEIDDS
ncbi:BLOC-1- complex subunit 8 [Blomia tropicalis]|nr:BLOC-1- complex subunit 8 [Blomia tropicalis]